MKGKPQHLLIDLSNDTGKYWIIVSKPGPVVTVPIGEPFPGIVESFCRETGGTGTEQFACRLSATILRRDGNAGDREGFGVSVVAGRPLFKDLFVD